MGLLDQAQMPTDPNADPNTPPAPDPAAPPSPDAAAPDDGSGDVGDGEPNVTPEEQKAYDEFVKNGLRVIYDGDKAREEVVNRLRQHPDDPVGTLANVTVWLEQMLEASAESSGAEISDDVKLHGAIALMEELAEVAGAAKIHDYNQKELNAALLQAMDLYREAGEKSGAVDPAQLKGEFDQIVSADKAGKISSVLPQVPDGPPGQPTADPDAAAEATEPPDDEQAEKM